MAFLGKSQSNLFGKIITQDGSPAANVNIELKELKKYTTSDLNGVFSFNPIADGRYTLIASYTGLQTKQQQVTVPQDKATQLNIVLSENASELQEVIINSKKGLNNQLVSIESNALERKNRSTERFRIKRTKINSFRHKQIH